MPACSEELPEKGDSMICASCQDKYPGTKLVYWDDNVQKCVSDCPETNLNGLCVTCQDPN